jgi:hypothetical protein
MISIKRLNMRLFPGGNMSYGYVPQANGILTPVFESFAG